MNAYVLSGWIVAMVGTALYSGWTIVTSRRIATQVLAVEAAMAPAETLGEKTDG